MRFSISLLLVLFLCTCVRAQIDNFQPALITLKDGSSKQGWVSAENNRLLAKIIRFRPEKTARQNEQRYAPEELQGVFFPETGQSYKTIPYSFIPVGDSLKRNEFRLAELLYDGVFDLYTFDRSEGEYFTKGDVIAPRTYYLVDGEEATVLEKIQRAASWRSDPDKKSDIRFNIIEAWRGKLTYYFQDWPAAGAEIKKIEYTNNDLIRIFDAYTRFKDPAEAKTDLGGIQNPFGVLARLNVGNETRILSESVGADKPTFGLGIYFNKSPLGSNGTVNLETGLEIFLLSFDQTAQRNTTFQYEGGLGFRVPLYGNLYLSKQGAFKPRLRFGGSVAALVLYGDEVSFLGGRTAVFVTQFDLSLLGGLGADIGRVTLDASFDTQLGPLLSVGYRL